MFKRLKAFFDKHDVIFKAQYGFRDKHSPQHAILDIVNTTQSNMASVRWPTRDMLQIKETLQTKKETLQTKKERCK